MNYKEQSTTGTVWQRCHEVHIYNPLGSTPQIRFDEQQAVSLPTGAVSTYQGYITKDFDQAGVFPLLDPATGEPTGQTMTHSELYQALYSLYMLTALERDAKSRVSAGV